MARSTRSSHSNKLVITQYRDHVLGKNVNPKLYSHPNVREAVGWLTQEEGDFIILTSDRSVNSLPYETPETFLIILKSNILELKEVK